ncbi:MAG: ABC transporter permease subunit [Eubacteriales bacterium]|nr:ABC transporter permease subunit [Eubacteriales bacterium]
MAIVLFMKYVPIMGWVLSVFEYRPGRSILECEFVGLKYFEMVFTDWDIMNTFKNTLIFSGIGYLISPLPMIFAICLGEITHIRTRKIVQTITTFPHFVSWVIVYSLAFAMFSHEGVINTVFYKNLGWLKEPSALLTNEDAVYIFQTALSQWKGLGWSSIIYIAAIAGIDQELYEAASIDGAGRFRCALHITVPGLMPTFIVLLLLSVSNFINTGYEQYYVFKNAVVYDRIEVLDLYIYRMGMQLADYSYATAVGILKSVISVTMLFIANFIAKRVRGTSIV